MNLLTIKQQALQILAKDMPTPEDLKWFNERVETLKAIAETNRKRGIKVRVVQVTQIKLDRTESEAYNNKLTEGDKQKMVEYFDSGFLTADDLAKVFGIHRDTVYYTLRTNGSTRLAS